MKKKGFTLIELLAVIVILAIIALIATPIILNIISDSKEETIDRSVEMYGSAVKNAVAQYQLNNNERISGTFTSSNDGKTLTKGNTTLKVEYNGNVKCETIEIYEDGNIYLENCSVTGTSTTKTYGTQQEILVKLNDICTPVTQTTASKDTEENLVGKIPTGNYELGEEYVCEVKEGTSYNFFILSKEGNKVNLIMDSNVRTNGEAVKESNPTTEQKGKVAWVSKEDYMAMGGTEWQDYKNRGNNNKGPITALKYLKEATSSWNKVSSIVEMYTDESRKYGEIKLTGHARMPKKAEIAEAGCTTSQRNCPLWMVNYLHDDTTRYPTRTAVNGVYGYWTLYTHISTSYNVWHLYNYGYVYVCTSSSVSGVRPVITLEI